MQNKLKPSEIPEGFFIISICVTKSKICHNSISVTLGSKLIKLTISLLIDEESSPRRRGFLIYMNFPLKMYKREMSFCIKLL